MDIPELIKQALTKASEYYKSGDYVSAEELYRQILRVDGDNAEALELGALAISQNDKIGEAIEWIGRVRRPGYETYNNMGLLYGANGQKEEAVRCFRRATELMPGVPHLKINLAIELSRHGQREEALRILGAIQPQSDEVLFNHGAILHEAGDVSGAVELYQRALRIRPGYGVCHYNLSACWFLLGEYELAWPEYEWRWQVFPHFAAMRDRFSVPYWRGEDLSGKTIVLYNEQGYGDLIMAAQFFGELAGTVVLECPAEMIDLMKPHVDVVCVRYDGRADYQCSVMSVPGVLKARPKPVKYLSSVGIADGDWGQYPGKRVGICWTGNPMHPNDRNRSCEAARFAGLDGTLFSFQKDVRPHAYPGGAVVDWAAACHVVDLREHMTDFNRTAKLLEQMDEVVTVDSCIAHLSGALGIPTKLLLCKVPDWRWGLTGTSTHWYASVKLYRQERAGDWDSVFKDVMSLDRG